MLRRPTLVVFLWLMVPVAAQAGGSTHAFTLNARNEVAAFAALTESDLDAALTGARVLAETSDARSGDWARIAPPLSAYAARLPEAAAVWFGRPDGSYYSVEKGLTGQNVGDRAYFPQLMAGQDIEGDLVISHSTGKKSIVVAAPVVADGKTVGAIGVSISAEKLAAKIDRRLLLPSDIIFYALDREGRTALHREGALIFDLPTAQGSPTLSAAAKAMLSKPEGVVRYRFRGGERVAVFRASARTGWVFVVARIGKRKP